MATENPYAEDVESALERRNLLLKIVEPAVIRKAWFILSHLLLDEGARVVDMGCNDGAVTYAMAAMSPKIRFIGLDKSKRQISKAKETFQLHNLDYKIGDAASEVFEPESLDAIINSFVLHEVYSASRYNERIVGDALRRQFQMLKRDGAMFIQDYANPPPGEFVMLEMPDAPSLGDEPSQMSDADLLVWYSQYARPKQDPGCSGFFLEELPARFPKTRLFRLPHKWAYEFLMRKDNRRHWDTEMPMEYTFYTIPEFRRELRGLGARVQYSAPHWDDAWDDKDANQADKTRMFKDDGTPLGAPPSCFVLVAYKLAERRSLNIEERRPSATQDSRLKITAMRDQKTGKLTDVVSRGMDISEILPYYVDADGQLKIYLHDGVAKSIVGAVPRSGASLDERLWSGHMVEALAVPSAEITNLNPPDAKATILFARDHISLRPQEGALLEKGPDYYPSPDYIDERIYTFYLKVEKAKMAVVPRNVIGHDERFQAKGLVREFDAQQVLNAINVGMIPNSRLELQILSLFNHLNIKAENWTHKKLQLERGQITGSKKLRAYLSSLDMDAKRFREVKGSAGELRGVHSMFVEEGQTRGAVTGLSAQDVDFVIFEDRTINTAVVLPLTENMRGEVHAAFLLDHAPVPERRQDNGLTANGMTFNLPPHIVNMDMARQFVAEKFSVLPEMVIKMGECYFTHIGVTPQKIYPFAVAVPPKFLDDPKMFSLPLYQLILMGQSKKVSRFSVAPMLTSLLARTYRSLNSSLDMNARMTLQAMVKQRFSGQGADWSLPLAYNESPLTQDRARPGAAMAPLKPGSMGLAPEWDRDMPAPQEKTPVVVATAAPTIVNPPAQTAAPTPPVKTGALPSLLADFEQELEQFFDDLEIEPNKPAPRDW